MAHRCVRTTLPPARSTQAFRMRFASEQKLNGVVGLITTVSLCNCCPVAFVSRGGLSRRGARRRTDRVIRNGPIAAMPRKR